MLTIHALLDVSNVRECLLDLVRSETPLRLQHRSEQSCSLLS